MYDITLLTDARYVAPLQLTDYIQNILTEDQLLTTALEKRGLRVHRTNWDNPDFDWTETRYIVFRTTWDYFERFTEFSAWLEQVSKKTKLINPLALLRWNMDKHYLLDLQKKGIPIPNTLFIKVGETQSLSDLAKQTGWTEWVLKPAVSGAGRHTYRLNRENLAAHESVFRALIAEEAMLLQEFQYKVLSEGEATFMVFDGQYSHAVLKKAKQGDFRVQDDFGGTVHEYKASSEEIAFVEKVMACVVPTPIYARVDVIVNNQGNVCVSELEMVEPELWMRHHPLAAAAFAEALLHFINSSF